MNEKKPKCWGCRKRDKALFYYWWDPNNTGGHLWHYGCLVRASEKLNINVRNLETK